MQQTDPVDTGGWQHWRAWLARILNAGNAGGMAGETCSTAVDHKVP